MQPQSRTPTAIGDLQEQLLERCKANDATQAQPTPVSLDLTNELPEEPQSPPETDPHNVEERLTKKFGLGNDPRQRSQLYRRIARSARDHGSEVLRIISDAVYAAQFKRTPDRWFCKTISRRLTEAGCFSVGDGAEW